MSTEQVQPTKKFPWRRTIALVIIVFVTAVGCLILIETGPKANRRQPEPMQANVKVRPLERGQEQVIIEAMGSVIPQRSIDLGAQVSGEVIELGPRFSEGSLLAKGELIAKLDDRDYNTAVQTAEATLAQKKSDLAIESGSQTIAKREWELIKEASEVAGVDSSLALRAPQLQSAQADVAMAEASLSDAKLNLQRTTMVAPFNAIVLEKDVDLGSYVSTQSTVASLAGTDTYWVRTAIPESQLQWIKVPTEHNNTGSSAKVYPHANSSNYREGHIVALLGNLDPDGRMARVLIAVEDPFSRLPENAGKPPLLLDDYVRVEISGTTFDSVYSIPRENFHDGSKVWLASEQDKLEIREVTPIWQGKNAVIIDENLKDGERLVLSNLPMPAPGLLLVVADEDGKPLTKYPAKPEGEPL